MSLLGMWEGIWDVRMQIVCINHATNEIGVLTVCHDEQPYLFIVTLVACASTQRV